MIKKNCFISAILLFSFIFTNFIPTTQVLAYEPLAFGEIKVSGEVMIESSTGSWMRLQDVYPLLKNTKLKTGDGVAIINTKNGSIINLSKNTEATIEPLNEGYTSNLEKGTLSFNINITSNTSLTIITPHATVSAVPNPSSIKGIVLCSNKGTEVRSISGKINVSFHGLPPKALNTGEHLFVSSETSWETATAATVPATGTEAGMGIHTIIATGLVVSGGLFIAVEMFREEDVASPSSPSFRF
ncbi:MAG: hypothetical protein AB1480_03175 [Nitrospirota bacterium]